jgi:HSP20 family protein
MAGSDKKPTKQGKAVRKAEPVTSASPFDDKERMFAGMFPRGWMRPFYGEHPFWEEWPRLGMKMLPRIDIIDRDNEIVVHAQRYPA